jgi:hypothetical protein
MEDATAVVFADGDCLSIDGADDDAESSLVRNSLATA